VLAVVAASRPSVAVDGALAIRMDELFAVENY
jgi:hypothetical protein